MNTEYKRSIGLNGHLSIRDFTEEEEKKIFKEIMHLYGHALAKEPLPRGS